MASSEERLLALTYINSSTDKDTFQQEAILKELGAEVLIEQLTKIANVLAGALAISIDPEKPTPVKQVIEDLRTITYED